MRRYCIAQGTVVNALWYLNGKEVLKGEHMYVCVKRYIYIYIYIWLTHFAIQEKLTQL